MITTNDLNDYPYFLITEKIETITGIGLKKLLDVKWTDENRNLGLSFAGLDIKGSASLTQNPWGPPHEILILANFAYQLNLNAPIIGRQDHFPECDSGMEVLFPDVDEKQVKKISNNYFFTSAIRR